MTTFEDAKAQRNWLERLGEKIPGFRGFQDRELRRDVDKGLREQLAKNLEAVKANLRRKAAALTDAGAITALGGVERLDRRIEGLAQAIRFTDYGATGLFDAVKIGDAELERLYAFDDGLAEEIATLGAAVSVVPATADAAPAALTDALGMLEALESKWANRRQVITAAIPPAL
jgi:hypothetical protein